MGKLVAPRGERAEGRGSVGLGEEKVQTTTYKVSNLQGCIVAHGEISQCFMIALDGVGSGRGQGHGSSGLGRRGVLA